MEEQDVDASQDSQGGAQLTVSNRKAPSHFHGGALMISQPSSHGFKIRYADKGRYMVDAEDPVEIVDPQPWGTEEDGRDYLDRELYLIGKADEVVRHTSHIEEQGTCRTEHDFRRIYKNL